MTKKTGVNRRLLFAKNSILMLVMLVIVGMAIYAWYYVNKQVSATGITVSAAEPDEVQIAVTEGGADTNIPGNYVTTGGTTSFQAGSWAQTASFSGPFEFSTDVTSNGLDFIVPGFSSTEDNDQAKADARKNGKIVNLNAIPTTALSNLSITTNDRDNGREVEYYSVPFYLRSRKADIYVKPSAYLAMAAEGTSGDAKTGAGSVRKSAYGNFTADTLVAAMRVSLTGGPVSGFSGTTAKSPASNESTFVWVPRPDLFLGIPAGASEDDWSLVTGVTKTTSTLTRLGESVAAGTTFKHNHYVRRYDGNSHLNGVTLVEDASANNNSTAFKSDTSKTITLINGTVPTLGEGKKISEFSGTATKIGDYYYYKYYLNLWIEGTDTEARRAMDTGKFDLHIEFGNTAG